MRIHPRDEWQARPPKQEPTARPVNTLKGVVVHWFGVPANRDRPHDLCPQILRGVQAAHQAGEFNDIAYGHAVCPHGSIYELRGFGVQVGANGTTKTNERYGAVVYMAGVGDKPAGQIALRALGWLVREYERRGSGKKHRTHGSITGSSCPGPQLTRWVKRQGWKTRTIVPPVVYRLVWRHGVPYTECGKR